MITWSILAPLKWQVMLITFDHHPAFICEQPESYIFRVHSFSPSWPQTVPPSSSRIPSTYKYLKDKALVSPEPFFCLIPAHCFSQVMTVPFWAAFPAIIRHWGTPASICTAQPKHWVRMHLGFASKTTCPVFLGQEYCKPWDVFVEGMNWHCTANHHNHWRHSSATSLKG